ncbi:MAG: hypothetical protein IJA41_09935 [Clostridia bacterium]|nr:hypothetical protein [Clostridia bacterium]
MNKLLSLLFVFILSLSMVACGGTAADSRTDVPSLNSEPNTVSENSSLQSDAESDNEISSTADTPEWKQFILEYNNWVDSYIEVLKKYKSNPTDISIMVDYTEMISDMAEWSEKADVISDELADSPEAALEYASELAKIAARIAEAAY